MKFSTILTLTTAAFVAAQPTRRYVKRQACGEIEVPVDEDFPEVEAPEENDQGNDNGNGNGNGNDQGNNNGPVSNGDTLVLFEVGGVPNNECLTFRNNGDIVNAACVNEAADRQFNPAVVNGVNTLVVQRGFSNGFRPDLVGVQVCVGFNGSGMRAEDCNAPGIELASFDGTNIRSSSGACLSGHNDVAEVTVDVNGNNCAEFIPTSVAPTPP